MKRFGHTSPIWFIVVVLAACAFAYSVWTPSHHGSGLPAIYFAQ